MGYPQKKLDSISSNNINTFQEGEWFQLRLHYGPFNASYATLSLERDTTTELTAQLSILEEKFSVIKEDLIKEKAITKQYEEEIRGTKNIIALNKSKIDYDNEGMCTDHK